MIPPRVLDQTALVALFAANQKLMELWEWADVGEVALIFPAAAVAEASHMIGADDDAWRVLLYPATVLITPLDDSTAIGCAARPGSLAVRQVVYEAQAASGVIVTRAPWQYPPDAGPFRLV